MREGWRELRVTAGWVMLRFRASETAATKAGPRDSRAAGAAGWSEPGGKEGLRGKSSWAGTRGRCIAQDLISL